MQGKVRILYVGAGPSAESTIQSLERRLGLAVAQISSEESAVAVLKQGITYDLILAENGEHLYQMLVERNVSSYFVRIVDHQAGMDPQLSGWRFCGTVRASDEVSLSNKVLEILTMTRSPG